MSKQAQDALGDPAEDDPGLDVLAGKLAHVLQGLSAESRWHLQTALNAADIEGVGGTLVIQFQRRNRENAVVKWAGGAHHIQIDL